MSMSPAQVRSSLPEKYVLTLLLFLDSRLDFDGARSGKLAKFLGKPRYVPGPGLSAS